MTEGARLGGRRRRRGDEGQSATELALVLPLVAVLLLAVVQLALVARDQVLVVHAAREAAREAAVDRRPGVAEAAASQRAGLKRERLDVETSHEGVVPGTVLVTVRYRAPTEVPIVGRLLPDVVLEAKAAMRVEV